MTSLRLSLVTLGALIIAVAVMLAQRQSNHRLREENRSLQTRQSDLVRLTAENTRLSNLLTSPWPAADAQISEFSNTSNATTDVQQNSLTNVIARIFHGDQPPELTTNQLAAYLDLHHRDAGSLITAYRTTKDSALLQEAKQKFPNDPMVAFESIFQSNVPPAERQQWLETFRRLAPDNSLPDYFSALDHFQAGEKDQAVRDLSQAAAKRQFQDYSLDFVQNSEEAYRAAGYSEAEAKTFASMGLILPDLAQAKKLGISIGELIESYRQAGDDSSAQNLASIGAGLGRRFKDAPGQTVVGQLVGIAVEKLALANLYPEQVFGESGQTVKDRLNEIAAQKETLKELSSAENFLQSMPDRDIISYWDRWRTFGSQPTFQWAASKYGQK